MTIDNNTPDTSQTPTPKQDEGRGHPHPEKHKGGPRRKRYAAPAIAGVVLLAFGAAAGAGTIAMVRPSIEMAPMTPVAISSMQDTGQDMQLVTVKGKVVEVFGNKFVVEDQTGRALIETGRAGEGGKLVAKDELVSVQGRFDNGFIRASFLIRADGKTEAIGPVGGPPHEKKPGWLRHVVG